MKPMYLHHEAPKGQRINRHYMTIDVSTPPGMPHLWFRYSDRSWVDNTSERCSSHAPCRTLKAFKRHLRRHQAALSGRTVTLVNRYVGYDVTVQVP